MISKKLSLITVLFTTLGISSVTLGQSGGEYGILQGTTKDTASSPTSVSSTPIVDIKVESIEPGSVAPAPSSGGGAPDTKAVAPPSSGGPQTGSQAPEKRSMEKGSMKFSK